MSVSYTHLDVYKRQINAMLASYHSKPALASVSSQYQANVPQYFLNIDRDKMCIRDRNSTITV